jgi:hypothetical protein
MAKKATGGSFGVYEISGGIATLVRTFGADWTGADEKGNDMTPEDGANASAAHLTRLAKEKADSRSAFAGKPFEVHATYEARKIKGAASEDEE